MVGVRGWVRTLAESHGTRGTFGGKPSQTRFSLENSFQGAFSNHKPSLPTPPKPPNSVSTSLPIPTLNTPSLDSTDLHPPSLLPHLHLHRPPKPAHPSPPPKSLPFSLPQKTISIPTLQIFSLMIINNTNSNIFTLNPLFSTTTTYRFPFLNKKKSTSRYSFERVEGGGHVSVVSMRRDFFLGWFVDAMGMSV